MNSVIIIIIILISISLFSSSSYVGASYYLSMNNKICSDKTIGGTLLCPINILTEDKNLITYADDLSKSEEEKPNFVKTIVCENNFCKYDDAKKKKVDIEIDFDMFYLSEFENKDGDIKNYIMINIEMFVNLIKFEKVKTFEELENLISFYQNEKSFNTLASSLQENHFNYEKDNKHNGEVIFIPITGDIIFTTFKRTFYKPLQKDFIKIYIELIQEKIDNDEILPFFDFIVYLINLSQTTKLDYLFRIKQ